VTTGTIEAARKPETGVDALVAEVASLRDDNSHLRDELARAQAALDVLRTRYHQLIEELHLLKRRLTIAKAERPDDVASAQLAFEKILAETQALEKVLDTADARPPGDGVDGKSDAPGTKKQRQERTGLPVRRLMGPL